MKEHTPWLLYKDYQTDIIEELWYVATKERYVSESVSSSDALISKIQDLELTKILQLSISELMSPCVEFLQGSISFSKLL